MSDVLSVDRDFRSFKGFDVQVTTSGATSNETNRVFGTLLGRDATHVKISIKGKVCACLASSYIICCAYCVLIPTFVYAQIAKFLRADVLEVRLPPPKFEEQDIEARKLR